MNRKIRSFIVTSFRSVWTLELLLELRTDRQRAFAPDELVSTLRASDAVVARGTAELLAAGLILEEDGGRVRYAPGSRDMEQSVEEVVSLYRSKPDAVRRTIVAGAASDLTAFADAFRLKGERE